MLGTLIVGTQLKIVVLAIDMCTRVICEGYKLCRLHTENSMSRLFHTNQNFKVIPEGWDGTTKDPDEVHYDISMKEDETLYQEFVQRMNFNKMKGKVKHHKHSRKRPG